MSSYLIEFLAVILYLLVLFAIGVFSFKRNQTASDYLIGGRGLNFWLTALAAHASDMSSWLFIAYPSTIFLLGMHQAWAGIGLIAMMGLNWLLVAPRVRIATEQYNSLTFSSFFESRLGDTSGVIRIFTAIMCIVFYTVYISAGVTTMGILMESLFNFPYHWGIFFGVFVIVPYVFAGGYTTLAWIDLFQGLFLMCVILIVPMVIFTKMGGWNTIQAGAAAKNLSLALLPDRSVSGLLSIVMIALGWGLGYFGQPHIVTKFMGIRSVKQIYKSMAVGMSWMVIALTAATFVGILSIGYFAHTQVQPQEVFIEMVRQNFNSFSIGLILCAILAVTINSVSSQVLVLTTSFTEDIYKKIFRKDASSKERLLVSRLGVVVVSLIAILIAYDKTNSIYTLVLYAWSGLGASFGPLMLLSLYSKKINKYGAWAGILAGGLIAATWDLINDHYKINIPALIPGFTISYILILLVSSMTKKHTPIIQAK